MASQKLVLALSSVSPLIMHNGRLVDPQYWASIDLKKLSSKRSKTDADLNEMARIEFLGSLYLDENYHVVIPDVMLEAALTAGAKKLKLGNAAKAGLIVDKHAVLDYGAQLSPDELWAKSEYVLRVPAKIGQAKIIRTRPIFQNWKAQFTVQFLDDLLSADDVLRIAEQAGLQCGIGDWRPKHGRFTVQKV